RPAAPDGHRVGGLDVALHDGLPAGREDITEEQHLIIGEAVGYFHRAGIGVRDADVFRLAARIAAGQMGVAEQPRGGVTEHLVGHILVPVAAFADRVVAASALLAFAADDGEGHHDAVADFQSLVFRAHLYNL